MELTFGYLPGGLTVDRLKADRVAYTAEIRTSTPRPNPLPEDFHIAAEASASKWKSSGDDIVLSKISATLLWVRDRPGPLSPVQLRALTRSGTEVWVRDYADGIGEAQLLRDGYLLVARFHPHVSEDGALEVATTLSWHEAEV